MATDEDVQNADDDAADAQTSADSAKNGAEQVRSDAIGEHRQASNNEEDKAEALEE